MTPDLRAAIERLEAYLQQRNELPEDFIVADDFWDAKPLTVGHLQTLLDAVRGLERDAERLRFVAELVDGIGDVDLYEEAGFYASAFGREEPNDSDYIAAVRTAIDAAMAKEQP